jgi:hypothetical protein
MYQNQLQYLIGWTGYDSLTSEPARFVDGLLAVEKFHQCYPGKPGPRESVLGGPRTKQGDNTTAEGKDGEIPDRNEGLTEMV